jgi:hypothetical protein
VLLPPVLPGSLAGEDADVPVAGGELLAGGGEDFVLVWALVELLADGAPDVHAGVGEVAGDLVLAGGLAGAPLPPVPGAGGTVPVTGDVVVAGGVVTGGGVVLVGGVVVGPAVAEPVEAGGLVLRTAGGVTHVATGPGWNAWPLELVRAPELMGVPPPVPVPPPLPPCPAEPLLAAPSAEALEVGETTCGSSVTANAPAATTKTAMPMPATGRSQPYRGRAWPGLAGAGRKRSMTARQATRTGSIQRRSQVAVLADQADADSRENIGRLSRSLIRSSPSADGSIESAAACSARRRASS